ncbi:MAG: hypothetical protein ABR574_12575 [Cryomorphaceae bacterium]|nr:hypothetical protein [Flavobacteriales bacterium]
MKVLVPEYHFNAVSYTFKCLFKVFLGIEADVVSAKHLTNFVIVSGEKSVSIANVFFGEKNPDRLFSSKRIPNSIDDGVIKIGGREFSVLSIFGKTGLTFKDNNHILLKSDIVGSTFFMLSRWEESVIESRDVHKRFDYRESLSVKFGFYQRPIVNEYVELLWELCRFFNPELKRTDRKYTCTFTSDIDELRKWKKPKRLFESVYLHLSRLHFGKAYADVRNYLNAYFHIKRDFYNNLDYLVREANGVNTIFYLKTGYSHPRHDKNRYKLEDYAAELNYAAGRGVKFGIHPNYDTYLNPEKLREDIHELQLYLNDPVSRVRQHYLRFSVPETWKIQANANLLEDSTMIFSHRGGFRNGVCYSFPVFDFKANRELGMFESPVLLMETAYSKVGYDQLIEDANRLVSQVEKYKGNFVFLWHNGNLVYKDDRHYFEKLIELASAPQIEDAG